VPKKYKLFTPLNAAQVAQLQSASIGVDQSIENEMVSTMQTPAPTYITYVETYLFTQTEQQDTLIRLLFNEHEYRLEEWYSDERYKEFGRCT
jgi:hypothetical protein